MEDERKTGLKTISRKVILNNRLIHNIIKEKKGFIAESFPGELKYHKMIQKVYLGV